MSRRSRAGAPHAPLENGVVGGRYHLQRQLGGGGTAHVYEVIDAVSGKRLALKRPDPERLNHDQARMRDLFAREFHTLSQLAHPRIVAVHDYGFDDLGPFYTMELLDGGDLQQLLPVPPLRVCEIARDVCSALSLLHSRRIVHRDLNPRNIRCTAAGTAKLIDFGAMCLMGPSKELVGTPAYCAPETLHLQPLDARTDLYSLGATLYYALTGRHAYPVREFVALQEAWHCGFTRVRELAPDIPDALDALILDLLQLDPQARPSSAAEVLERLSAIEGRQVEEPLLAARAYLAMPAIVGRDAELAEVRSKIARAANDRGCAILIEGAPGVGRSRLLDATVLAGKLSGVTVLRADADDAARGDYGVVRALIQQLKKQLPGATRRAAEADQSVLLHVVPELDGGQSAEAQAFEDLTAMRLWVQQALQHLWLNVAREHPLLIAIDDLHRIDEPSTAAIALLARGIADVPITLAVTAEAGAPGTASSAFRVLSEVTKRIALDNLRADDAAALLRSVFGTSAELEVLARRMYAISRGNPRDMMRLAQHLVDHDIARYRAGSWSLPSQLDAVELPSSVAAVLRERVAGLSPSANALACAFALRPELSFSFEECSTLAPRGTPAQVIRDLEQLVTADLVRAAGERYALADRAWVSILLESLSECEAQNVHRRLALAFERRGGDEFLAAQHLLRAGEVERAIDLFVSHAESSVVVTEASPEAFFKLVRSLPPDAFATYREVLRLCDERGRPKKHAYALRARIAGIAAVANARDGADHTAQLVADLRAQSGLDDWAALDPTMESMARLVKALDATQQRYDAAPEHERVLDPASAIRALGRSAIETAAAAAGALDLPRHRALPDLTPFTVLSPAISVIQSLVSGVTARLRGQFDRAREVYAGLIERTAAADHAGLTESHHRYMRLVLMSSLAMIEASMGLRSSLTWAERVASDSMFKVNAVLIRMLYYLWQGDAAEADRCERQVGVLRIQSSGRMTFENTQLLGQVTAHAAMDDLSRLKRTVDEIRTASGDFAGWQPVLAYARAEYQRVCGNLPAAIAEFSAALSAVQAGEFQLWSHLAGSHVRSLDDAGRTADAVSCGQRYLADAVAHELDTLPIRLPLSVATAKLGRPGAGDDVQAVIDSLQARGTTGLWLGLALEARCRVALADRDRASYERYIDACEDAYAAANNPALAAKRLKLRRDMKW